MQVLDLERSSAWPKPLIAALDQHTAPFLRQELSLDGQIGGAVEPTMALALAYDEAYLAVARALKPYALRGWHCTRLTHEEVDAIMRQGFSSPDGRLLSKRIAAVQKQGLLNPDLAQLIATDNQADQENRKGMVWFCFFPPRLAGQSGIGRFFRHWGGESLYWGREELLDASMALRRIGTPCVVEADVPIALLNQGFLPDKIMRRLLIDRGLETREPVEHEGYACGGVPAEHIRAVHRYPSAEFKVLTGCDDWEDEDWLV